MFFDSSMYKLVYGFDIEYWLEFHYDFMKLD